MLLGDISLMTGDTQSAMKNYLKEAVARFGLFDGGIVSDIGHSKD